MNEHIADLCIEILQNTNDGDDLTQCELSLLRMPVMDSLMVEELES